MKVLILTLTVALVLIILLNIWLCKKEKAGLLVLVCLLSIFIPPLLGIVLDVTLSLDKVFSLSAYFFFVSFLGAGVSLYLHKRIIESGKKKGLGSVQ